MAKRTLSALFGFAVLLFAAHPAVAQPAIQVGEIPHELSDEAFWQMVEAFSEPDGRFPSENLVSNETTFQEVVPQLTKVSAGGVYLGVGPDQNFTYIAALQPAMAFIVDIRRQNLVEHLMYKALFELSADRADFLSKLFSRPRPEWLETDASAEELVRALRDADPSPELFHANLNALRDHLMEKHGFRLTEADQADLRFVFEAFFLEGPMLTYDFPRKVFGPKRSPNYADLLVVTDRDGRNRSYMASEENFRVIKDLHRRNAIVPIVGDFGGDRALHEIGDYLKSHGATVDAFYFSNVEQYLFPPSTRWVKFYSSLDYLPRKETSLLIRSVFSRRGSGPWRRGTSRYDSLSFACSIGKFLSAVNIGQVQTYQDVISFSQGMCKGGI